MATTKAFTNYGAADVDSSSGGGGSRATFGGTLANDGTLDVGNSTLSAATTVTANGLNNAGTLSLVGSAGALAEFVVNGAATTSGSMTIGADSEVDVTGSKIFTQAGGSTTVTGSLVAATIDADYGTLDFASVITSGDGVGVSISRSGDPRIRRGLDSTHAVDFRAADGTLALGDAGAFGGIIDNFSGSDAIDLLGAGVTGWPIPGEQFGRLDRERFGRDHRDALLQRQLHEFELHVRRRRPRRKRNPPHVMFRRPCAQAEPRLQVDADALPLLYRLGPCIATLVLSRMAASALGCLSASNGRGAPRAPCCPTRRPADPNSSAFLHHRHHTAGGRKECCAAAGKAKKLKPERHAA